MVLDLDIAFAKLTNPRMSVGLMILHSLLTNLKGEPIEPKEVRETVDKLETKRVVSKQSITNAAIRLEDANIIERKENKYAVNYGYLLSLLLNTMLQLNEKIVALEEEVELLKTVEK